MEIKKILDSLHLSNAKSRVILAHRLIGCSPIVKKAIIHWTHDKTFEDFCVFVDCPNKNDYTKLSSKELVEDFGMTEIESFLFLDAIIKANKNEDKTELSVLLGRLSYGNHLPSEPLSEDQMKEIEKEHPDIWQEYLKLCCDEEASFAKMEKEYNTILKENI